MMSHGILFILAFVTVIQGSHEQMRLEKSPKRWLPYKRLESDSQGLSLTSEWIKMNPHQVCFYGKGNRNGHFVNYIRSGLVAAIKLEYLSGEIRCVSAVEYNSRWGCGNYPPLLKKSLDVVVTDNNNQLLFPSERYHKNHPGLWYWLPFVDTRRSKELVFTDYAHPFHFPKNSQMKVWYGEDLKNWAEGDNQGHVCVNVYAKFMN